MITLNIAGYADFDSNVPVQEIKLVHRFYSFIGCISSPFITLYDTDCCFGIHSTGGDGIHWFLCRV